MFQWCLDWWFSVGMHVELKTRVNAQNGKKFGPYVDLHLGCVILSLGRNPVYSGELECSTSTSRGGIPVPVE